MMKNVKANWNFSMLQHVGEPWSINLLTRLGVEYSVSFIAAMRPNPALSKLRAMAWDWSVFIDLLPKSLFGGSPSAGSTTENSLPIRNVAWIGQEWNPASAADDRYWLNPPMCLACDRLNKWHDGLLSSSLCQGLLRCFQHLSSPTIISQTAACLNGRC
jgi:hypothetical protein